MTTKYMVIHNKHEGCYDFNCYEDKDTRMRITSIRINPPKVFLFETRDQAQDFFEEYMNDIDCTDIRCKQSNDEVEHIDYCTCGIIELDKNGEPVLFYNKKNQIFLLEQKQQLFMPDFSLKSDINNMNLTNKLFKKVKKLDKEQRQKFIELGKYCEDCNADSSTAFLDDIINDKKMDTHENTPHEPNTNINFNTNNIIDNDTTNNKLSHIETIQFKIEQNDLPSVSILTTPEEQLIPITDTKSTSEKTKKTKQNVNKTSEKKKKQNKDPNEPKKSKKTKETISEN